LTTTYYAEDPTEVRVSVSAVVRRRGEPDRILLMRRSDNAHWGLPGGYVEPGESVESAAQREVREETGYEIEVGRLVGVYSDPRVQVIDYGDGRRVHAINLCFEALAGLQRELGTPDETLELGFFAVDALPQPFVPIHAIRVTDSSQPCQDVQVR
jgi:ADP-ribose pyrophosphatase YjhB (NUDIX family)